MTFRPTAGQRNGLCYQLDILADQGEVTRTEYFETLQKLAQAACKAKYGLERVTRWDLRYGPSNSDHWVRSHLRAYSFRGKSLDILLLCAYGATSYQGHRRYLAPGYIRRGGPVYGIRKWRGGPRYRHCQTMGVRRQSAAWLPAEGEPECRPSQRDSYLYHSWDGRHRPVEHCWKAQHKGRKAWDR